MIEFIDKTSEQNGTPINRENLMAMQGFEEKSITFMPDGSIVETKPDGTVLTINFNEDGSVSESFSGEYTITKTTIFNNDGSITEVIL